MHYTIFYVFLQRISQHMLTYFKLHLVYVLVNPVQITVYDSYLTYSSEKHAPGILDICPLYFVDVLTFIGVHNQHAYNDLATSEKTCPWILGACILRTF